MVKRMLTAAAVSLFVVSALATDKADAAESPACRLVKMAELPFKFESNKALVQTTINGKIAWFAVDTGAEDSSMLGAASRALGLSESTADGVRFYGVGGGQDGKMVVIGEFGLGAAKVKNVRMFSIGHRGSPEFAGLLGRDFLDQVGDMEFDIAAHALRFWRSENCGARSLAYWTKTPLVADLEHSEKGAEFVVKLIINGKAVDAELDSGADTTTVTPDVARTVGVSPQHYETNVIQGGGIGEHAVEMRVATFDSVVIGDEEVKHARLQVADMFAANTENQTGSLLAKPVEGLNQPRMLLGADFLRSHRVLLARGQRRLYFTYSGGPVFQVVGDVAKPALAPPPAPSPRPAGQR